MFFYFIKNRLNSLYFFFYNLFFFSAREREIHKFSPCEILGGKRQTGELNLCIITVMMILVYYDDIQCFDIKTRSFCT